MKRAVAAVTGSTLLLGLSACGFEETVFSTNADDDDPSASAVSVPQNADLFRTSATGPETLNTDAEEGDPLRFVDPSLLTDDGQLKGRMSATEAQAIQVLSGINDQLTNEGLSISDVATVRVYLTTGRNGADFDGWEKAYRRYFANIDPNSGEELVSPTAVTATKATDAPTETSESAEPSESSGSSGSSEPSEPSETASSLAGSGEDNPTKPSVSTVGVAEQPVDGWMLQVEVEAYSEED